MNFKIFTLFPNMFSSYFKESILGRALEKKIWSYQIINIRDYSRDKHHRVDDVPFGGGEGMVINPEVISSAIDSNCDVKNTKFYYMSRSGKVFTQEKIREIIEYKEIAIICGRYEGVDQRVIDEYGMEEISIGDYILTGGEIPTMALVDACVRCVKGVLGNENSLNSETFGGLKNSKYKNLLEYPLYTHPRVWRNREVPDVLLSGNHKNIDDWKLKESEKITKLRRKDLWKKYRKSLKEEI